MKHLARILPAVLTSFAPLASSRRRRPCRALSPGGPRLRTMLELSWDGEWYRRGYYDDGTPLGSSQSAEGKIDSIPQSWAVLSGAVPLPAAERALDAVHTHLVRRSSQTILLLTPPFDRADHDPGYIRAYVPGIRENGGQYTHAAVWIVMARGGNGAKPPFSRSIPSTGQARSAAPPGGIIRRRGRCVYEQPALAAPGWMVPVRPDGCIRRAQHSWVATRRLGIRDRPVFLRPGAITISGARRHSLRNPGASQATVQERPRGGSRWRPGRSARPLRQDGRTHSLRIVWAIPGRSVDHATT